MNTRQSIIESTGNVTEHINAIKKWPLTGLKNRWIDNDIILNMGFRQSLVRGAVVLFLPWPLLASNHNLLIYSPPVMSYLSITALLHFFLKNIPGNIG